MSPLLLGGSTSSCNTELQGHIHLLRRAARRQERHCFLTLMRQCLAQLRPRAKVVVMDARGSKRAVRLARTLLASGISQAHIMQVQSTYGLPKPQTAPSQAHALPPFPQNPRKCPCQNWTRPRHCLPRALCAPMLCRCMAGECAPFLSARGRPGGRLLCRMQPYAEANGICRAD